MIEKHESCCKNTPREVGQWFSGINTCKKNKKKKTKDQRSTTMSTKGVVLPDSLKVCGHNNQNSSFIQQ